MGYFKETEVTRITLPSNKDYWVDVVGDLTWGQIKKIGHLTEDQAVDFETTGDAFLLMAIQAWNLDDESGTVLEVTAETIDRLNKDDAIAIINAASGVIEDDDAKKNSSSQSTASTPAAT